MISVALCTYNGASFIREQIESILNQTKSVDEIIICDDGSTDNTLEIIEELSDDNNIIHVYQNKTKLGVCANFQKAVDICRGEIIFLSDQDDVWEPQKVETITSYFDANKKIQVVFTDALLIDINGNKGKIIPNNLWSYHFKKKDKEIFDCGIQLEPFLNGGNHATGATMAFRKELIIGRPFTSICQHGEVLHDYALAIYAAENNALGYIEEPLIRYRIHEGQSCGLIKVHATIDYQIYVINTCVIPYLQNPKAIEIAEFTKLRLQLTRKKLGWIGLLRNFHNYNLLYHRTAIKLLYLDILAWRRTHQKNIIIHHNERI